MRMMMLVALCAALSACADSGQVAAPSDCGRAVIQGAQVKKVYCPRPFDLGMDGMPAS